MFNLWIITGMAKNIKLKNRGVIKLSNNNKKYV